MNYNQVLTKIIIPLFYSIAILIMIVYQWNEQNSIRKGGSTPLYQNLSDNSIFIKRGFDLSTPKDGEWVRFKSPPFRVMQSDLTDLPKRKYLSPFANKDEEFTIAAVFSADDEAISYLENDPSALPGLFIACIGENWEIYLNGSLIRQEMYLDESGQIKKRRTWRDVYFPIDKDLIRAGENVLSFRIVGDPAYDSTGIYYVSPNYIDDYRIIEERQKSFMLLFLCGVFGFTGLYYIMLFLSIKQKKEIFNLYYGIFSFLLCGYSLARNGLINYLIPNSDISIRLEFFCLFTVVPFIGLFIESLGRKIITKPTWFVTVFCVLISILQIFFCAQFGQELLFIWNAVIIIYFSYVFAYDVIYFYFWEQKKKIKNNTAVDNSDNFIGNVLLGSVIVYLCGVYDILDVFFFHNSFTFFLYSCFVFHIGIAFTLSQRFSGMYKQLEQSNTILEKAVQERTMELEQQTEIAVNASKVKTRFLATMSHEIRTPMNAITGMAELLLRKDLGPEANEYVQDIKQAGNNLILIINDILDITKIEAGKLEIINDNYQLNSLLADIVSIINIRLKEKPIRFIIDIDKTIPNNLIGDKLRLGQIFLNLLSNAVKYSEKGQINFSVTTERRNDQEKKIWLKITVADTGFGIKPEDLKKIFEDFVQVNTNLNRGIEGTGLGLTITKRLCAAMGGEINVESEYGKGSIFTAIIPQDIASNEPINAIDFESLNYQKNLFEIKYVFPTSRILVVDDLPANLKVAEGLLDQYKAVTDVCESGVEAVEIVKYKKYDLILMDHMMPVMDGIEATAKIREWEKENSVPRTPIIALTANAISGMRETFLENGFDDFIAKPIDIIKLDEILNRWLDKNKKVNLTDSEKEDRQNGTTLKITIPGVDTEKGFILTGRSAEKYKNVLSILSHDTKDRLSFLQKIPQSQNINQFVTQVHALKSALATIGADDLSKEAAALEQKGIEEDFEFIKENISSFTNKLSELIKNIDLVLGDT